MDAIVFLRLADRILNDSQGTKTQEIHFQQPQLFQGRHRKLRGDGSVRCAGKRHKFVHRTLTDHDTSRMHGGVSRKSLQTFCHVNEIVYLIIILVCFPQVRALF